MNQGPQHALITGGAGFIGSHVVDGLLASGWKVTVVDNMDPFYPRALKEANVAPHVDNTHFRFMEGDILDDTFLDGVFHGSTPYSVVVHLAAKAGVRPSIVDPLGYHRVNVTGTLTLLERAKQVKVPHFILASSSSVYGEDPEVPWREEGCRNEPISPYAATKLMAEGYARMYSLLFGMRITALRFFTVYGPRQRPDLAIHRFTRNIDQERAIVQYGDGTTRRDYTYVLDVVNGILGAINKGTEPGFTVYNIGNSHTVALHELIQAIEEVVGKKALIDRQPEQAGDVPQTFADISKAELDLGYSPKTALKDGLKEFLRWYEPLSTKGLLP